IRLADASTSRWPASASPGSRVLIGKAGGERRRSRGAGGSSSLGFGPSGGQGTQPRPTAAPAGTASVDGAPLGRLDQSLNLVVGEPGEPAVLGGDGDRNLVRGARLAHAAQVEAIVDRLLKFDRPLPALRITLGELVEPVRPDPDVGDLVGEHVVDGVGNHRVR